jgi:hypothetical protein
MPAPDQRPPVSVEDLLRLKRAERPAPEFWAGFERELRQKQLAALLQKRPWWHGISHLLARRAYLPVGATAILAFTLVSVKYYAPAALSQTESPSVGPVTAAPDAPVALASALPVNHSPSAEADRLPVNPVIEVAAEPVELMPLVVAVRETERPTARQLAANLAETEAETTSLDARFEVPAQVAAAVELASVPVNPVRRSRLLASYDGRQLSPEPTPPAVVRERLARRLGDNDAADRGSRLVREPAFSTPLPQIVALRF